MGALLVIVVIALFYFIPTIVAYTRQRTNTGSIFVVNLFLGWMLIG